MLIKVILELLMSQLPSILVSVRIFGAKINLIAIQSYNVDNIY